MQEAEVIRMVALADLDTSDRAVRDARERVENGDVDYLWLLEQREAGSLLLACLHVSALAEGSDGQLEEVAAVNHGVWLERDSIPKVEGQVSRAALKDLPDLAGKFRERGLRVRRQDMDDAYFHVELGQGLRDAVASGDKRAAGPAEQAAYDASPPCSQPGCAPGSPPPADALDG